MPTLTVFKYTERDKKKEPKMETIDYNEEFPSGCTFLVHIFAPNSAECVCGKYQNRNALIEVK